MTIILALKLISVMFFIVSLLQFYVAMRALKLSKLMTSKNANLLDFAAWQALREKHFMWPTAKNLRAIKKQRA